MCDFLYDVFRLQGKTGKMIWKINKLLHNIFVTSSLKTTKNQVTKMGWKQHIYPLHFIKDDNQITKWPILSKKFQITNLKTNIWFFSSLMKWSRQKWKKCIFCNIIFKKVTENGATANPNNMLLKVKKSKLRNYVSCFMHLKCWKVSF